MLAEVRRGYDVFGFNAFCTVFVFSGLYSARVKVDESLFIVGTDAVESDSVTFMNFRVQ